MFYIWLVLIPVITAALNRFRGGGLFLLPGETIMPDHKRTQVRRLVYAAFLALAAWNIWPALIVYLSLMTGWGYPVSTAVGAKSTLPYESEFSPFDWLAEKIVGPNNPSVYGLVWLTIHGFVFGAMLAIALGSAWPLLWGLMGLAYKVARDWERGEICYGLVQGASIVLYLLTI